MKDTAAGLAALGRGSDSMLVHMSPREVGSLQTLAKAAGGSLSINPHTGLPEAGFLEQALPMIVAGGLTMMGVPAWGVGLGSGLTAKATGQSTQNSLMTGLLAGGGAGLFGPTQGALPQMGDTALSAALPADAGSMALPAPSYMDRLSAGVSSAADSPMQFLKDNKLAAGALGIGALGAMGGFEQPGLQNLAPEQRGVNARLSKPWQEQIDPSAMGRTDQRIYTGDRYAGSYAEGGIAALDGGGLGETYAAGGRLLEGPGDGVSDDIPAVIQGEKPQRAALADGEFVVPARIVSELGNGSTKAGAKRLYAMMDRVQKARGKTVGKDKVAVDSKASRHLPA